MMIVLPHRRVVRLSGADWQPFLHRLLTCATLGLRAGEVVFGALLTPQGKVLCDVFVWARGDHALIETDSARLEVLIQRLQMYRLKADVEMSLCPDMAVAVGWGAELPTTAHADPRLPALGWRQIIPVSEANGISTDDAPYHLHQMQLGVPDLHHDVDATQFPIEANMDLLGGIDFRKGCFVGQEVSSRMKRRGQIKSRMVPLRGMAAAKGSEILCDDLRAGVVTSSCGDWLMALMRLDRCDGPLTLADRLVHLAAPDWLEWPA